MGWPTHLPLVGGGGVSKALVLNGTLGFQTNLGGKEGIDKTRQCQKE